METFSIHRSRPAALIFMAALLVLVAGAGALGAEDFGAAEDIQPANAAELVALAKMRHAVAVDCDAGDSLRREIIRNANASAFWVIGDCQENQPVVVDIDDVVIRGFNGASLSGAGFVFDTVKGATLRDFTVFGVPGAPGVQVSDSVGIGLYRLTVEDTLIGFNIQRSVATVNSANFRNHQVAGLAADFSTIEVNGSIIAESPGVAGILATNSTVQSDDFELEIESSGGVFGFIAQVNSTVFVVGGSLDFHDNMVHGMFLAGGTTLAQGANISLRNNGGYGAAVVVSNWIAFMTGEATTTITGNGVGGILEEAGAELAFAGPTLIAENNGPGIFSEDGSMLTMFNVTLRDNLEFELFLIFGTIATFGEGNTVDGLVGCDESVVIRGEPGCTAVIGEGSAAAAVEFMPIIDEGRQAVRKQQQLLLARDWDGLKKLVGAN